MMKRKKRYATKGRRRKLKQTKTARRARRYRRNARQRKTLAKIKRLLRHGKHRATHRKPRRRYGKRQRFHIVSKTFLIRHRSRSTPGKVTDRLAVVVRAKGRNIAFYQSTGTGGGSSKGDWVPFNGISRRGGGWFIKIPGKVPTGELARIASQLRKRVKKPTKVFDDGDYRNPDDWNKDVNSYIAKHEGLHSQGSLFQHGTVNFRET